ncbi:hypothetical protein LMG28688_06503 [Paraburkholderia caffeinitolerans]|uniref:Uncharacterized protein n=1 Tax=Paraburkholderia caffeinitolerans TaxID=1723730 RepID=A0A6J5GUF3_9BURK|nr:MULTISPECIES: hypothetical protein [Paraburkholderia]CAB3807194.1 hypothetical protein LMG28688_06503 [Paraburkholderia caffeinitolerans]
MTLHQVVLVDKTKAIDPALLQNAAAALSLQASKHLPGCWSGTTATVSYASNAKVLPPNSWPIYLVKALPPGEGGFHQDKRKQPYAEVIASPDDPTWTIDASHEMCEMLVDPYGNRMQSSQAIAIEGDGVADTTGEFSYLVEVCDPCEANQFAYEINGIAVSDFITPDFYDTTGAAGVSYSYTGSVTRPRDLLKGGYISYIDESGDWQQILWVDPNQPPQYNALSALNESLSWREAIHAAMGDGPLKLKRERRSDEKMRVHVASRVREFMDRLK